MPIFSGARVGLPGGDKLWHLGYALRERDDVSSSERERARASPGGQAMTQVQPQGAEIDHPALSDVIERNIQNQVRLRIEAVSRRTFQERISDAITAFSGSLSFVYLHALWFGL
jgi:hypothetical protein